MNLSDRTLGVEFEWLMYGEGDQPDGETNLGKVEQVIRKSLLLFFTRGADLQSKLLVQKSNQMGRAEVKEWLARIDEMRKKAKGLQGLLDFISVFKPADETQFRFAKNIANLVLPIGNKLFDIEDEELSLPAGELKAKKKSTRRAKQDEKR